MEDFNFASFAMGVYGTQIVIAIVLLIMWR